MNPLVSLNGSGKATLHLIDPALEGGVLTAQGFISPGKLRRGRVFRLEKRRYRLLESLAAGVHAVPLSLTSPIALEAC